MSYIQFLETLKRSTYAQVFEEKFVKPSSYGDLSATERITRNLEAALKALLDMREVRKFEVVPKKIWSEGGGPYEPNEDDKINRAILDALPNKADYFPTRDRYENPKLLLTSSADNGVIGRSVLALQDISPGKYNGIFFLLPSVAISLFFFRMFLLVIFNFWKKEKRSKREVRSLKAKFSSSRRHLTRLHWTRPRS
jgi:hypothetical protein